MRLLTRAAGALSVPSAAGMLPPLSARCMPCRLLLPLRIALHSNGRSKYSLGLLIQIRSASVDVQAAPAATAAAHRPARWVAYIRTWTATFLQM